LEIEHRAARQDAANPELDLFAPVVLSNHPEDQFDFEVGTTLA
jgi:hypothetical protein